MRVAAGAHHPFPEEAIEPMEPMEPTEQMELTEPMELSCQILGEPDSLQEQKMGGTVSVSQFGLQVTHRLVMQHEVAEDPL